MVRLVVVVVTALIVVAGVVAGRFGLGRPGADPLPPVGLAAGVLVGSAYFFIALGSGKGMIQARLTKDPERPNDPNAAISMGLGAAGIGCSAAANPHYPSGFRSFYMACAVVGLLIAVVNAWRSRGESPKKASSKPI